MPTDFSGTRANGRSSLSSGRWLLLIAAVAFLLRVAVRAAMGSEDFWQNGYTFYFDLARSLADGNGFAFPDSGPTASRVPLYPMFLAAVTLGHKSFVAVLVAQSLVGAATALCAGLLAREMFDDRVALVAAALTAVYPYYVVHDTALQETALFTFLTLLSVILLLRTARTGSRGHGIRGCGPGGHTRRPTCWRPLVPVPRRASEAATGIARTNPIQCPRCRICRYEISRPAPGCEICAMITIHGSITRSPREACAIAASSLAVGGFRQSRHRYAIRV
jgi:Dolichyl-phosphate-mannose-protein mannosyltransferase